MSKYIDADLLVRKIKGQIRNENLNFAALGGGGQTICINTLEWVLKQITSLQQEQPQVADASKMEHEVDLEKFAEKIKTFQGRYKHPEIVSIKGAMAFMARLFYQYPNTAREWYESLPKATMDNVRKEE